MAGDDLRYMARAIDLARTPPFTSPNPRVGAVVVRNGTVLAEAAHEGAGTPHAEAIALETAGDARGATLYVNLEPCSHYGRMPPCAPALVRAGIARVVCAMEDPDERVRGSGISYLRDHGIAVDCGLMEEEARRINRAFIHHRITGRPLTTVKLALSADGRLAAQDGSARWITGAESRRAVHARRLEADAVMVGAGTVVADDPLLTVREVPAPRQPLRVVVDSSGRIAPSAAVFRTGGVLVATTDGSPHDVQTAWKETGAEVVVLPRGRGGGVDLGALLLMLGTRDVVEIYCEGGPTLATSLLAEGLVDRLELYYGPVLLGRGGPDLGDLGIGAMRDATRWRTASVDRIGDDARLILERTEAA